MRKLDNSTTCLLFDLDGTLVDSVPDISTALDLAMQDVEKPAPGVAACRQWIGGGVDLLIQRALTHWAQQDASSDATSNSSSPADAEGTTNLSATTPPFDIDPNEQALALERFLHHYAKLNGRNSQLYPGAREILATMKHQEIPMACVTNKPEAFAHDLLKAMGIDDFFTVVLGGDTLPTKKPDAAPLLRACEQLHRKTDQAIMIGDSRADQAAAKAADIRFVWIGHGYHRGETAETLQPWHSIDTLSALHDVLEC
ncbi:MAG: phosphoglycolate phosphatase [Woeseiaceae bacterium]